MIIEYIEEIEEMIYSIGGNKVFKCDDCIMSNHLYELPNNLYFEIFQYHNDQIFEFKLGKLHMLSDSVPRVFVLEPIELYYKTLVKLNLCDKNNNEINIFNIKDASDILKNRTKNTVDILLNRLPIIIKNYYKIINEKYFISESNKLMKVLKNYDIKEVNSYTLNETVQHCKANYNGKRIKKDLYTILHPTTLPDVLAEIFAELGVGLVFLLIGIGFHYMISMFSDKDLSNVPLEFFMVIGCAVILLIALPIIILLYLRKMRK